ncbi:hypothetical protein PMIN07_002078 [Paraphaeosphaeria minitans]|uniref:Uncharacterized protein n=1 Tax=Paraphaeosphaeria minitans TaxID=565426 RepID=A0A9P6GIY4_9PLEO|nr:hypothetical protein PMIN01_06163 [Paraphaeosphaeria minitans]
MNTYLLSPIRNLNRAHSDMSSDASVSVAPLPVDGKSRPSGNGSGSSTYLDYLAEPSTALTLRDQNTPLRPPTLQRHPRPRPPQRTPSTMSKSPLPPPSPRPPPRPPRPHLPRPPHHGG